MRNPGVASQTFVMPNNRRTLQERITLVMHGMQRNDAYRHQTKVASHTAVPLGTAKWLGRTNHTPGTLPLGKGQGLLMSPTQRQADIIGGNLIPAISKNLKAFLYGWLPLSNAYGISNLKTWLSNDCLSALPSLATQHKSNGLTSFHTVAIQHIIKH